MCIKYYLNSNLSFFFKFLTSILINLNNVNIKDYLYFIKGFVLRLNLFILDSNVITKFNIKSYNSSIITFYNYQFNFLKLFFSYIDELDYFFFSSLSKKLNLEKKISFEADRYIFIISEIKDITKELIFDNTLNQLDQNNLMRGVTVFNLDDNLRLIESNEKKFIDNSNFSLIRKDFNMLFNIYNGSNQNDDLFYKNIKKNYVYPLKLSWKYSYYDEYFLFENKVNKKESLNTVKEKLIASITNKKLSFFNILGGDDPNKIKSMNFFIDVFKYKEDTQDVKSGINLYIAELREVLRRIIYLDNYNNEDFYKTNINKIGDIYGSGYGLDYILKMYFYDTFNEKYLSYKNEYLDASIWGKYILQLRTSYIKDRLLYISYISESQNISVNRLLLSYFFKLNTKKELKNENEDINLMIRLPKIMNKNETLVDFFIILISILLLILYNFTYYPNFYKEVIIDIIKAIPYVQTISSLSLIQNCGNIDYNYKINDCCIFSWKKWLNYKGIDLNEQHIFEFNLLDISSLFCFFFEKNNITSFKNPLLIPLNVFYLNKFIISEIPLYLVFYPESFNSAYNFFKSYIMQYHIYYEFDSYSKFIDSIGFLSNEDDDIYKEQKKVLLHNALKDKFKYVYDLYLYFESNIEKEDIDLIKDFNIEKNYEKKIEIQKQIYNKNISDLFILSQRELWYDKFNKNFIIFLEKMEKKNNKMLFFFFNEILIDDSLNFLNEFDNIIYMHINYFLNLDEISKKNLNFMDKFLENWLMLLINSLLFWLVANKKIYNNNILYTDNNFNFIIILLYLLIYILFANLDLSLLFNNKNIILLLNNSLESLSLIKFNNNNIEFNSLKMDFSYNPLNFDFQEFFLLNYNFFLKENNNREDDLYKYIYIYYNFRLEEIKYMRIYNKIKDVYLTESLSMNIILDSEKEKKLIDNVEIKSNNFFKNIFNFITNDNLNYYEILNIIKIKINKIKIKFLEKKNKIFFKLNMILDNDYNFDVEQWIKTINIKSKLMNIFSFIFENKNNFRFISYFYNNFKFIVIFIIKNILYVLNLLKIIILIIDRLISFFMSKTRSENLKQFIMKLLSVIPFFGSKLNWVTTIRMQKLDVRPKGQIIDDIIKGKATWLEKRETMLKQYKHIKNLEEFMELKELQEKQKKKEEEKKNEIDDDNNMKNLTNKEIELINKRKADFEEFSYSKPNVKNKFNFDSKFTRNKLLYKNWNNFRNNTINKQNLQLKGEAMDFISDINNENIVKNNKYFNLNVKLTFFESIFLKKNNENIYKINDEISLNNLLNEIKKNKLLTNNIINSYFDNLKEDYEKTFRYSVFNLESKEEEQLRKKKDNEKNNFLETKNEFNSNFILKEIEEKDENLLKKKEKENFYATETIDDVAYKHFLARALSTSIEINRIRNKILMQEIGFILNKDFESFSEKLFSYFEIFLKKIINYIYILIVYFFSFIDKVMSILGIILNVILKLLKNLYKFFNNLYLNFINWIKNIKNINLKGYYNSIKSIDNNKILIKNKITIENVKNINLILKKLYFFFKFKSINLIINNYISDFIFYNWSFFLDNKHMLCFINSQPKEALILSKLNKKKFLIESSLDALCFYILNELSLLQNKDNLLQRRLKYLFITGCINADIREKELAEKESNSFYINFRTFVTKYLILYKILNIIYIKFILKKKIVKISSLDLFIFIENKLKINNKYSFVSYGNSNSSKYILNKDFYKKVVPFNLKLKTNFKFFEVFFYFENSFFFKNFSIFLSSFITNINPYRYKISMINKNKFILNANREVFLFNLDFVYPFFNINLRSDINFVKSKFNMELINVYGEKPLKLIKSSDYSYNDGIAEDRFNKIINEILLEDVDLKKKRRESELLKKKDLKYYLNKIVNLFNSKWNIFYRNLIIKFKWLRRF